MKHKRTNGATGNMNGHEPAKTRLPAPGNDRPSPPAPGRLPEWGQALIERQKEADRLAERWLRAREGRDEGRTSLLAIETLRKMALDCVARLSEREEPATTEELACLARILRNIEGADKIRRECERMRAKAASRDGGAARDGSLSPETVFAMRRAAEGTIH